MWKSIYSFALCFLPALPLASQQVTVTRSAKQDTSILVSFNTLLDKTLATTSLTEHGQPFHAELTITPEQAANPERGTVVVDWIDAQHYRTRVETADFTQERIVSGTAVEETNRGNFYPSWLRNYRTALLDPMPRAGEFRKRNFQLRYYPASSRTCMRIDDRPGGITDQMTWGEICLGNSTHPIDDVIDFTYFMDFEDFQPFGDKLIARTYINYGDDNQKIIGRLKVLEPLSAQQRAAIVVRHPTPADQQIETRFVSIAASQAMLVDLPKIDWPSVHEGKTDGYMLVHVVTDRTGQVRESEKHNSDNPGLEAFGRSQALRFRFKPLIVDGHTVQMETPLVLHFTSHVEHPLPVITGDEIAKYAEHCNYHPVLPAGILPSGTTFTIRVSVNEKAELTGEIFPQNVPWEAVQRAGLNTRSCHFKPYLVDGVAWYHHIDFRFTAP